MKAYRPVVDGIYAVIGCKLKQNGNEGCNNMLCNSCASLAGLVFMFCTFYFICHRSFTIIIALLSTTAVVVVLHGKV